MSTGIQPGALLAQLEHPPRAYERLDGRWRLVDLPGELYERAKELCR